MPIMRCSQAGSPRGFAVPPMMTALMTAYVASSSSMATMRRGARVTASRHVCVWRGVVQEEAARLRRAGEPWLCEPHLHHLVHVHGGCGVHEQPVLGAKGAGVRRQEALHGGRSCAISAVPCSLATPCAASTAHSVQWGAVVRLERWQEDQTALRVCVHLHCGSPRSCRHDHGKGTRKGAGLAAQHGFQ